ncbi:hypothetical protein [Kushneria phosphatilytica]|uniref:Uncharacterized protein n=1 Tax=Kushneria phosphatilytica TaxID=657387 RepID=A0A1S1NZ15_9GAMM|nr:hypothetical protein [Kushneria phosphatilytica]OHV12113.1 hypothetical protein BH688_05530 [Kushneria phosphatilytica]QEL11309.1 hypothetical protein FY550_09275 [Kushneria phosphatilytica]
MLSFPFSDSVVDMLSRETVRIVFAVYLDFQNTPALAHSGTGVLTIDGRTYQGVGSFGSIEPAKEELGGDSPTSLDLTLSGLDSSIVSSTLKDRCRGRDGKVYLVAIDDETGDYSADILFSGKMDAASFNYSGNGDGANAVTVTINDRMTYWQRKGTERWTYENHKARHPGDDLFYAVAQLSEWPIYWGAEKDAPSFEYPG